MRREYLGFGEFDIDGDDDTVFFGDLEDLSSHDQADNPLYYGLDYDHGAIGVYDRQVLAELGAEDLGSLYITLQGGAEVADRAKIAELHHYWE